MIHSPNMYITRVGNICLKYEKAWCDDYKLFCRLARRLGLPFTPKFHFAAHIAHQLLDLGAVAAVAVWKDEVIC